MISRVSKKDIERDIATAEKLKSLIGKRVRIHYSTKPLNMGFVSERYFYTKIRNLHVYNEIYKDHEFGEKGEDKKIEAPYSVDIVCNPSAQYALDGDGYFIRPSLLNVGGRWYNAIILKCIIDVNEVGDEEWSDVRKKQRDVRAAEYEAVGKVYSNNAYRVTSIKKPYQFENTVELDKAIEVGKYYLLRLCRRKGDWLTNDRKQNETVIVRVDSKNGSEDPFTENYVLGIEGKGVALYDDFKHGREIKHISLEYKDVESLNEIGEAEYNVMMGLSNAIDMPKIQELFALTLYGLNGKELSKISLGEKRCDTFPLFEITDGREIRFPEVGKYYCVCGEDGILCAGRLAGIEHIYDEMDRSSMRIAFDNVRRSQLMCTNGVVSFTMNTSLAFREITSQIGMELADEMYDEMAEMLSDAEKKEGYDFGKAKAKIVEDYNTRCLSDPRLGYN